MERFIEDMETVQHKKISIFSRKYIHEINAENDIKFRGPLSYRHLRIIGWAFLFLSMIGIVLSLSSLLHGDPNRYGGWTSILRNANSLMSSCFLIASFSIVLNAKDGYRRLLILFGGLTLLAIVGFIFVYLHYIVGGLTAVMGDSGATMAYSLFTSSENIFSFNIFIDLFLCTLATFFMNYHPTQYFKGKKIIIFRLLVIIPIIYEILSFVLKILISTEIIIPSFVLFPFLTSKPSVAFFVFLSMAIFIKIRERYFRKNGKTVKEYHEFLNTNFNSLQFSISLIVSIIVAAIIDVVLLLVLSAHVASSMVTDSSQLTYEVASTAVNTVNSWGIGGCATMILLIPLIIFFDYRKTYKDGKIDLIIPAVGIGIAVFALIEGAYLVLRIFLTSMREAGEQIPTDPAQQALDVVRRIIHK